MTENSNVIDNVLGWLHEGYPEGVPPKDYFPLLALLKRSLTEDEVVKAAQSILRTSDGDDPVTDADIHAAIAQVIEKEPNPRGDPSGRLAAGLGRLAVGDVGTLSSFTKTPPVRLGRGGCFGWSVAHCCGISISENSTRTPPVDRRAIAAKNSPASGVVTAALAAS